MEKTKAKKTRAARTQKNWKFNFLDIIILLLLLLFVAALVILMIPSATDFLGSEGDTSIVYTVVFSGVDESLALSANIADGQTVVDEATGRVIGTVVGNMQTDPYYEFVSKEHVDEEGNSSVLLTRELYEGKKDITVTLTANATYSEGKGYEVDGCRIACNKEYKMIFPGFTGSGVCTVVTEGENQ